MTESPADKFEFDTEEMADENIEAFFEYLESENAEFTQILKDAVSTLSRFCQNSVLRPKLGRPKYIFDRCI